MKIFRPRNIILSVILLVGIWIVYSIVQGANAPVKVSVQALKRGDLSVEISASGKIQSQNSSSIRFGAAGRIASLNVKEGDQVQKGQILGYISSTDIKEQENKAIADQRYQIEQLREFERLNENKPQDEKYRNARFQIQAQIDSSAAIVAQVRASYNNRALIAPISGTVVNLYKKQGEVVNGEVVLDLQDQAATEFVAEVDEQDIGTVQLGQSVLLNLDAYPLVEISGTVTEIENIAQTGTSGNTFFPVKVSTQANPELPLRIGMNGDTLIKVAQKSDVLLLPLEYLNIDDAEQSFIYVAQNNKVARKDITTGLQNDSDIEILNGASESEQLITTDTTNLRVDQNIVIEGAK